MTSAMQKPNRSHCAHAAIFLLVVMLQAIPRAAFAEVHVNGDASSVMVETQGVAIADVLNALGSKFQFSYRSSAELAQPFSGTIHGSLSKVISRLLVGYDYVIKSNESVVEVLIYASNRSSETIPAESSKREIESQLLGRVVERVETLLQAVHSRAELTQKTRAER